MLSSSNHLH